MGLSYPGAGGGAGEKRSPAAALTPAAHRIVPGRRCGLLRAMPLPDTMFCAQQIRIPPELPDILKQFTKAAIRTQPVDVLQWSAG